MIAKVSIRQTPLPWQHSASRGFCHLTKVRSMTSPPKEIEVICPKCNTLFNDWYRPSINLTLGKPWTEDQIRRATSITCPSCSDVTRVSSLIVESHEFRSGSAAMNATVLDADGTAPVPIKLGRVYNDREEFILMSDGVWMTDGNQDFLEIFTGGLRYLDEAMEAFPEDELRRVAECLPDGKWEMLIRRVRRTYLEARGNG